MTRAVILAAGEGTRLRPLTADLPKALVTLGGASLLARQLAVLRREGISDICIVAGHCAGALTGFGARVIINPRYQSTNMVSSLYCARALFDGTDDLVVAYGDIVYEPRIVSALLSTMAPIAVVVDTGWHRLWQLRMDDPLSDAESMKLGPDGNILELGRRPETVVDVEGQYIGMFKVCRSFAPAFFNLYAGLSEEGCFEGRNRDNMFMTTYLQLQIDQGVKVRAARVKNGWLEVDSIQDLARYEMAMARGELAAIYDMEA